MKTRNFTKLLLVALLFIDMVILPNKVFAASKVGKVNKVQVKSQSTSSITIKWDKVSRAAGYELYMATSKNGKYSKIATIKKGSTTSYTRSGLKGNKTYYFKARAYKSVNGKKTYSAFSSKKSAKVKNATSKTKEGRLVLAKVEAKKVVSKIITPQMTKQQKAEKICEYITHNVHSQSNQSTEAYKKNYGNEAYAALIMKKAACSGRCKAVTLLCDAAGLESKHINQNKWTHQWNKIKIDGGKWIVIDAQIGFVGNVHPLEDDSDDSWIVF